MKKYALMICLLYSPLFSSEYKHSKKSVTIATETKAPPAKELIEVANTKSNTKKPTTSLKKNSPKKEIKKQKPKKKILLIIKQKSKPLRLKRMR